jgi:hypothetical protein
LDELDKFEQDLLYGSDGEDVMEDEEEPTVILRSDY